MKKWLIWCLTVLAMVCLIPGIVLKAAAETVPVHCAFCGIREEREARRYEKYDSTYHRVYVTECQNCHKDGNITHLQVHSGGTQGPTCTEGKICKKCGAEYGILGHDWDRWTPKYDGTNTHTRRCKRSNCDAEETGSCSGGYATCDSLGMCNTCGGSYYGGHAWGEWSSAGNGTHTRSCTNYCREVDTANCTGGTATCSAKAVCEVCGGEYGEKDSNNHDLEQHAAKAPTCTEIGWDAYETCSRCDYTTRKELPALNHALVQHAAKAPTCTEKGWDAYKTCSRCDYTTYAEQPALKHTLEQHEAQAPTCTEKGWDAYEACSRCDYTTRKEIPALNHDFVHHDAQAPTCTEKGWAYDTCSRFGCNYITRKELPALNHDLKQYAAKAPTCTEIGWDAYETCYRCDYNTYQELPALNHDYQAVTVEPTCEADGYTVFTCSRCKDSYTADPTDQLGHQFGAWSPNGTGAQSADCLRQGCAHTGSTDCRKFTFHTAEGETLTFCPVCGQAENAAQLEKIEAATAWANSGSLSAEDVTARTNGEYLSVAFETAGSLTQPTGRVRLALPAGLLEGKTLVRIAPDGTQTELPFETERGTIILTLDFANSALPVMLFRLVPQPTAL
ncbi:hypothetical protein CGS55_04570 [Faecalibacterium prausnitzii]|uniref:Uncharacterized protein n=1 Tax=Faecalibacterium prausnitzii TaxID=853 RepID=A0A2A7A1Q0_9FIRM|nr:hypothetical protein [Faecalibacterium prausnitzii]PDX73037.1 hypothetical protein CGS55_04570 [Faecalibacterium prausnitzii]